MKASLNRSVEPYTSGGLAGGRNPINRLSNSTTRSWNDANRNYVPDCDLLTLGANGECGAAASLNFGSLTPEQNFDPEVLNGWGKRQYRLGVHRGRAARDHPARIGRPQLLPALVRQLRRDRQPGRHRRRFHAVQHHGAERFATRRTAAATRFPDCTT